MSARVYDSDEGEFVDFETLADWEARDKAKDARIEALEAALLSADDLAQEVERVCGILADDHGHSPVILNRLLEAYRRATGGGE
jgi:hypothetical protein